MTRARLRRWGVPALVFLGLVLAMSWRLWWPSAAARRAFNYDALWQYWGDLQFQIDAYRSGQLPIWNPWDRGGFPAHADPQTALFYPVNWTLVGLGLAVGPEWWLVPVKALLHLWLAAFGTFVFLRRRGTSEAASYLGGAVVVLTYPISKTLWTALNWGMAWAPWMLLAVDAWAERPTTRRAAAVALAFAMTFLSWAPAASWYALLVVVPYGLWAIAHHRRDAEDRAAWTREAFRTGGLAAGLFLAMTAAQLTASATLLGQSVRSSRDLEFIATTAFGPDDLFGFLVPRLPGEGAYMGLVVLFLAAAAVTLRPTGRQLVLAASAALGVLCALGHVGPYLPALASGVSPFGLFRRAHRYLYVTTLPLAILAAEGLDLVRGLDAEGRRRLARVAAAAAAALVLAFAVGLVAQRGVPLLRKAFGFGLGSALVAAAAALALLLAPERWRRWAAPAAVLLAAADLFVARFPAMEKNWDPLPRTPADASTRALEGVPLEARIWDRAHVKYRPGVRLGLRDFGGYEDDPMALRRYALVRDAAHATPRLLASLNVRWLLETPRTATRKSPADQAVLRGVRPHVWEVAGVVPAVMWVDQARAVDGEAAALAELRRQPPGAAVLERGTLPDPAIAALAVADASAPTAAGRIVEYRLDRLVAEIDAPGDGLVIVHDAWYPGWTARVDGQPAAVVPANVLFRGVHVGPGRHRIEMRYRADRWFVLAGLSLFAMTASVVLLVVPRWTRSTRA